MAFQPVPNCATLVIKYQNTEGEKAQNDYMFEFAAPPTAANLHDLVEAAQTEWELSIAAQTSRDWSFYEAEARSEDGVILLKDIRRIVPPTPGLLADDTAPNNATLAVKFAIALRGRGLSGRIFAIGLGESTISGGYVSETYATNIVNEHKTFVEFVETAAACTHVVAHRYQGNPPVRLPAGVPHEVIGYSYSDLAIDSQKLRLPNHKKRKRRTTP